jgi:hypothetical protein
MPRLPREQSARSAPQPSPLLDQLTQDHPGVVARLRRITAGWAADDPRWNDLHAVMDFHSQDVRKNEAARIRKHADDPRVKPHLLEGEWTGLRMAANLLHHEKD